MTVALLTALFTALLTAGSLQVSALDYSKIEKGLNRWQTYFLRTVMSISLKDAYDTGVLASITAGQAVYEGGIASFPISIIAQNHFGIKAYSNWTGKVYDDQTMELYNSYADAVTIKGESYARSHFWRAYSTWDEGISDHSALFHGEAKYAPFLAATNYKDAAMEIQKSGYAGNSSTYGGKLIGFIEQYGFDQLDEVKLDSNGVYGLIMDRSRVTMAAGETLTLKASAYPSPSGSINITWKSDRPEVATVDQNGRITAVRQGYTLITAVYNGKEACCVVEVDANAYSIDRANPVIYSQPDARSDVLGKLSPGQPVKIISQTVYNGSDGTQYYAVSASPGSSTDGQPVSGYVKAAGLYAGGDVRLAVGTEQTILYLSAGDKRTIPLDIYADELKGQTVVWSSSDESVVTVDQSGNIQCKKEGVAVISITIGGKLALTVTVYVGSAALDTLVANAAVNLRSAPNASSTVLGVIAKGQEVKLVSDPGDGWYRVLAVIGGHMLEGYSYSRYFDRTGSSNPSNPGGTTPSTPSNPSNPGGSTPGGTTVTYQTGRVNVDDNLNVRSTASTSGSIVAKLKNRHEVVILETVNTSSASYPKWYKIRFTYNNATVVGYVAADFIVITGTITETIPGTGGLSGGYVVEDEYVVGILPKTTLAAFRAACGQTVRVFREDDTELTDEDFLYSGDSICVYNGNQVSYVRVAAVTGDVNGDGQATATDYMLLKRAVLGSYALSGAMERAARVITGGSKVSANDYMLLKRAVLGTYSFK